MAYISVQNGRACKKIPLHTHCSDAYVALSLRANIIYRVPMSIKYLLIQVCVALTELKVSSLPVPLFHF